MPLGQAALNVTICVDEPLPERSYAERYPKTCIDNAFCPNQSIELDLSFAISRFLRCFTNKIDIARSHSASSSGCSTKR